MPKTIMSYKSGIKNIINCGINNAKVEWFNGTIQWLNHIAQVIKTLIT